ncbi:hypothetical protein SF123566_8440 [Shigella flexneri 1235-66]|nr:hypothetical protein SF123566_8440 [Shigella flexneri 1235-66]
MIKGSGFTGWMYQQSALRMTSVSLKRGEATKIILSRVIFI